MLTGRLRIKHADPPKGLVGHLGGTISCFKACRTSEFHSGGIGIKSDDSATYLYMPTLFRPPNPPPDLPRLVHDERHIFDPAHIRAFVSR